MASIEPDGVSNEQQALQFLQGVMTLVECESDMGGSAHRPIFILSPSSLFSVHLSSLFLFFFSFSSVYANLFSGKNLSASKQLVSNATKEIERQMKGYDLYWLSEKMIEPPRWVSATITNEEMGFPLSKDLMENYRLSLSPHNL